MKALTLGNIIHYAKTVVVIVFLASMVPIEVFAVADDYKKNNFLEAKQALLERLYRIKNILYDNSSDRNNLQNIREAVDALENTQNLVVAFILSYKTVSKK